MSFESLAYDTLKFGEGSTHVELSHSEKKQETELHAIFQHNKKLASRATAHLDTFPLFKKVATEPTDIYQFQIKKSTDKMSVHLLDIRNTNPARLRIVIDVEAGARVTIVERSTSTAYLGYELTVTLGEGAVVDFISAMNIPSQRTILRNAYVGKDAHIIWHEAVIEGALVQSHTRTYLYESGGRAEIKDLFALSGETVLDMYHAMYHLASHTKSDMLTKGVLQNKGRALYQGLIHIDERAVGCVGYQKQDTLVLSNNAEVNAVPNLEIENSDVKCSHGVTTAHIDREKLFYMQSRGIDEKSATDLFVQGHVSPCIDAITDEHMRQDILERIVHHLI